MRSTVLASFAVLVLALCALVGAQAPDTAVKVRFRLLDAETGKALPGIVRVLDAASGKPQPLPGLLDRLQGVAKKGEASGWYVVGADGATAGLPRGRYRVGALSGLETALATADLDLGAREAEVTLKLPFLFRPEKLGLAAGNTHLHLMKLSRAEADDYLRQIPRADGLRLLFVSYLERHKDDETYITNRYQDADLKKFDGAGILFGNGQEHRHNFEAYGQGYGHVMFLNLKQLVKPVSLGPGITGMGFDDRPLQPGIEEARGQGSTIVWCHNTNGHEATAHALAGRLDALNVFDGSRTGTFEERYYRLLNVGPRLPISTGTDWFIYDFSRVYAKAATPLSVPGWLAAVKAGRCLATNGPLLNLTVDGQEIGSVLNLEKPRAVQVTATGIGRKNFQELQLVHNGKVVKTQPAAARDGGYTAMLTHEVRIDEPGWLAVRIDTANRNEFELPLFAHTSPIYVDLAGQRTFQAEAARLLLKSLEEARGDIRAKGKFSAPEAERKVLRLYEQAAEELTKRGGP
ncbi:MAG: CehA/McbA family metallohydrolase [Planctomycetia bacterium]|nr:CehA/McbA family metallohydrolase [Planctomycetia bacterium]